MYGRVLINELYEDESIIKGDNGETKVLLWLHMLVQARPMVCRLHVVNSDPKLCANDQPADVDGYEVPETIEEMQEDITPLNQQLSDDPRWGQLGVMVQTVLKEEYGIDINNILLQHSKNNQVNDVLIAN